MKSFSAAPTKIGQYQFVNMISKGQSNAKKAIYSNPSNGVNYFVKIGTDIQAITNEFEKHRLFYSLIHTSKNDRIYIPKPVSLENIKGETALIMENLEVGKSIENLSIEVKTAIYVEILKFLTETKINEKLPIVTSFYQLISLPYFITLNISLFPRYSRKFLKCILTILKYSSKWLNLKHSSLCHGDINVTNILLSQDKIILLDFSLACKSHRYYNFAQALNSSWLDKDFQDLLWEKVIKTFKFSKEEQNLLKSFILFNLMQRLCKRYTNENQEKFYVSKMERLVQEL